MMGFSQPPPLNRCMVAFPEDYKLLVPRLLIETMNSISASFVTRIDTFTSEALEHWVEVLFLPMGPLVKRCVIYHQKLVILIGSLNATCLTYSFYLGRLSLLNFDKCKEGCRNTGRNC